MTSGSRAFTISRQLLVENVHITLYWTIKKSSSTYCLLSKRGDKKHLSAKPCICTISTCNTRECFGRMQRTASPVVRHSLQVQACLRGHHITNQPKPPSPHHQISDWSILNSVSVSIWPPLTYAGTGAVGRRWQRMKRMCLVWSLFSISLCAQ
jgi:hypothetical protein